MRRVLPATAAVILSLLFVPAASGLTLTIHSPTPGEYYNGTALLNWTASEPVNVTTPDLDLKAVDDQGRVVGRDASGRYVNQIPGADASGDRLQGLEWISVPDNSSARFVVDSTDILRYAEDLNLSANETAALVQTVNVTTINYGENPQLVEGPEVNDTVSTEVPATIGPGEQVTTSLPAEIDFDPDTVNLQSRSRWVTAYIELPQGFNTVEADGENTTAVSISSVKLNGLVEAADDDRFGFVSDPELEDRDGDGLPELMVKFRGNATRSILKPGRKKLTVTGKTVQNQIFSGSDRVRVIEPVQGVGFISLLGGVLDGMTGAVTIPGAGVDAALTGMNAVGFRPPCLVVLRLAGWFGCDWLLTDVLLLFGLAVLGVAGWRWRRKRGSAVWNGVLFLAGYAIFSVPAVMRPARSHSDFHVCGFVDRVLASGPCGPIAVDGLIVVGVLVIGGSLFLWWQRKLPEPAYLLVGVIGITLLMTPLVHETRAVKSDATTSPFSIQLEGALCYVDAAGNDEIVLQLHNPGGPPLDASSVSVHAVVPDRASAENVSVTRLNWSGREFLEPSRGGNVTVFVNQSERSDFLVAGERYRILVDFPTRRMLDAGYCVARQR